MARILTEDEKLAKRSKLIEFTTGILKRNDEAGLTVRGLARKAGISRTTLYLYSKDKNAISNSIRLATLTLPLSHSGLFNIDAVLRQNFEQILSSGFLIEGSNT